MSGHQRDRDGICARCGQGRTALDIVDGERPCERPDEETVTTVTELDALPIGSVVMEMTAEPFLGIPTVEGVFHKFPVAVQEPGRTPDEGWREWFVVAGHGARPASEIMLPARVLFRPTPEGSTEQ